jgi:hypothetical protein
VESAAATEAAAGAEELIWETQAWRRGIARSILGRLVRIRLRAVHPAAWDLLN